jgi:hypothetical protein
MAFTKEQSFPMLNRRPNVDSAMKRPGASVQGFVMTIL